MTAQRPPHLWIFGTSVSIERPGYIQHLEALAVAAGWQLVNLAVGDQCSVMGYLRVLQHMPEGELCFAAGDCAVWEYSLLDHFLAQSFDAADIRDLRLRAWQALGKHSVSVVALLMPPRDALQSPTAAEAELTSQATLHGVAVHDARTELSAIPNAINFFRDDRHLRAECPALPALAAALWRQLLRAIPRQISLPPTRLYWLDAEALRVQGGPVPELFSNSFLRSPAMRLRPDESVVLPATVRVVAAGVLSQHQSGALWCGHAGCPPSSSRLPDTLTYSFLMRVARVACQRAPITRLVAAPDWSFQCGHTFGYGFSPCSGAGDVLLVGVLVELMPDVPRSLLGALRRWFRVDKTAADKLRGAL